MWTSEGQGGSGKQRSSEKRTQGVQEISDKATISMLHKNIHSNKLRQLRTADSPHLPTSQPGFSETFFWGDRKERNKIAARDSRERKRRHIQVMEEKIRVLEVQMHGVDHQIDSLRIEIFNSEMRPQAKIPLTTQQRQTTDRQTHITKKLQGLLQTPPSPDRDNQLNICLDSFIYRIGPTGNERRAGINLLYQNLMNYSMPALYRYVIWSAQHHTHLFGPDSPLGNNWCREIEPMARDCLNQNGEKLAEWGERLVLQKQAFSECSDRLLQLKGELERQGPVMQQIVNDIREILTPAQVAELILFVERHQYKREVRVFKCEEESSPRKYRKEDVMHDIRE